MAQLRCAVASCDHPKCKLRMVAVAKDFWLRSCRCGKSKQVASHALKILMDLPVIQAGHHCWAIQYSASSLFLQVKKMTKNSKKTLFTRKFDLMVISCCFFLYLANIAEEIKRNFLLIGRSKNVWILSHKSAIKVTDLQLKSQICN